MLPGQTQLGWITSQLGSARLVYELELARLAREPEQKKNKMYIIIIF
jgi:hypothetical protein